MSQLWERAMEPCVRVVPSRVPDGEGGFRTSWEDGERFEAAITHAGSSRSRVAESEGTQDSYTVTTREPLPFHAAFRRLGTGKVLRAVSDSPNGASPAACSFSFQQCAAEGWVIPDAD